MLIICIYWDSFYKKKKVNTSLTLEPEVILFFFFTFSDIIVENDTLTFDFHIK